MNVLYVIYFNIEDSKFLGVKKKIRDQIKAIRKNSMEVSLLYIKDNHLILENLEGKKKVSKLKRNISKGRNEIKQAINAILAESEIDYIYFRFPGTIDFWFLNTLRNLQKTKVKVVLELPTYPIGGEYLTYLSKLKSEHKYIHLLLRAIIFLSHRINRIFIKKYIYKIVTFMPYHKVWGVNTVVIDNGINVDDYSITESYCTPYKDLNSKKIVFLAVANVDKWHGYDRMIEGLNNYYKTLKVTHEVIFNIVGEGPEISTLKKMVKKYCLEDVVIFHGSISDFSDLRKFYDEADIGIASLGMHRINLMYGSTLKTKEYFAMGLPFILSYEEKFMLNNKSSYYLKVESNDEPININDLCDFYNLTSNFTFRDEMKKYAIQNFDWTQQMSKVFL